MKINITESGLVTIKGKTKKERNKILRFIIELELLNRQKELNKLLKENNRE